jgi:hypothetical protein
VVVVTVEVELPIVVVVVYILISTYRRESIHTTHNKPGQGAADAFTTCARQQHKHQLCQHALKDTPPWSNPIPLLRDPRGSQCMQTVRTFGASPFASDSPYPGSHRWRYTAANASWNAINASGHLSLQSTGAAACGAQGCLSPER